MQRNEQIASFPLDSCHTFQAQSPGDRWSGECLPFHSISLLSICPRLTIGPLRACLQVWAQLTSFQAWSHCTPQPSQTQAPGRPCPQMTQHWQASGFHAGCEDETLTPLLHRCSLIWVALNTELTVPSICPSYFLARKGVEHKKQNFC